MVTRGMEWIPVGIEVGGGLHVQLSSIYTPISSILLGSLTYYTLYYP